MSDQSVHTDICRPTQLVGWRVAEDGTWFIYLLVNGKLYSFDAAIVDIEEVDKLDFRVYR